MRRLGSISGASKKSWLCVLALFFISGMIFSVSASEQPYQSYIFNQWGDPVPTPIPYEPVEVISGEQLGIGAFNNPQDLFVDDAGNIYVVDTKNNRIVHLDRDFTLLRVITEFELAGVTETFNGPSGIFVDEQGTMFIADTDNERVVQLDSAGSLERIITFSKPEGLNIEFTQFLPSKLVVDPVGRIFVAARNVFDGLMEFNVDGEFMGFVGAPAVRPSVYDLFWNRFATKEQRERRSLFLPIEYTNVTLDSVGFIYAVAKDEVRRLNPTGLDVLQREGQWPIVGDIQPPADVNDSFFRDITVSRNGIYHVLDSERGRVFTYDDRGNLLYVFGSKGANIGSFSRARSIANYGERLFVLDEQRGQITVFDPTEYARLIHLANHHYMLGNFAESNEAWNKVLVLNNHFPLAYDGLGMAHIRQRDYASAMEYFRLANNREYYSKAYAHYRKDVIERNFLWILLGLIALITAIVFWIKWRSKRPQQKAIYDSSVVHGWRRFFGGLRYALHVVVHPFDGFWDLKYEERGNLPAATTILLLASLSLVFLKQYTGYLFNYRDVTEINILSEVVTSVVTFLLWVVINWALTTLMEGKGTFLDIYTATAYALTPLILINFPITIWSNYMILNEGAYYYFFYGLGIVWSGLLVFFGTQVTHHYTPGKTLWTCVLNLVGMGVVVFLGLLFVNMFSMLAEYATTVYREIVYRL